MLALRGKRCVHKDECERDVGGAVIASVMFNDSCVVRLNCFLRLELGAFMITMRVQVLLILSHFSVKLSMW